MCLGIPGRVVALRDNPHLATVDVLGEEATINIGMLEEPLEAGDYVLIHVGFAMNKIEPAEARKALEGLQLMGNNDTEVDQWV
ncbi:MAG TPA: HypC/HybG/HupF family hydrogenase formation chaperone [Acidimicrobiales bacterium]|nr:HypC/HybG/HupF family hydrogenase formation chaperone [Acidimicrobiales bacterium]